MSFYDGFSSELTKLSFDPGSAVISRLASNFITHLIINTKASPEFIRTALGKVGKGFLGLGFKHGIEGRALRPTAKAAISTTLDPTLIATYDTAWSFGDKFRRAVKKVPFASGKTPFQMVQLADKATQGTLKSAPIVGAAVGGAHGYVTGKTKKNKVPVKSMIANALTGGLLGKGIKAYGPSAPVVKQLHYVRENVADKVLSGGTHPLAKLLDKLAK